MTQNRTPQEEITDFVRQLPPASTKITPDEITVYVERINKLSATELYKLFPEREAILKLDIPEGIKGPLLVHRSNAVRFGADERFRNQARDFFEKPDALKAYMEIIADTVKSVDKLSLSSKQAKEWQELKTMLSSFEHLGKVNAFDLDQLPELIATRQKALQEALVSNSKDRKSIQQELEKLQNLSQAIEPYKDKGALQQNIKNLDPILIAEIFNLQRQSPAFQEYQQAIAQALEAIDKVNAYHNKVRNDEKSVYQVFLSQMQDQFRERRRPPLADLQQVTSKVVQIFPQSILTSTDLVDKAPEAVRKSVEQLQADLKKAANFINDSKKMPPLIGLISGMTERSFYIPLYPEKSKDFNYLKQIRSELSSSQTKTSYSEQVDAIASNLQAIAARRQVAILNHELTKAFNSLHKSGQKNLANRLQENLQTLMGANKINNLDDMQKLISDFKVIIENNRPQSKGVMSFFKDHPLKDIKKISEKAESRLNNSRTEFQNVGLYVPVESRPTVKLTSQ